MDQVLLITVIITNFFTLVSRFLHCLRELGVMDEKTEGRKSVHITAVSMILLCYQALPNNFENDKKHCFF
jgi:hypothetical protein